MIGIIIFTITALLLGTLLVLTDNHFKKEDNKIDENLPGYNCGVCGFGSCAGMKEAILEDPDNYKRCKLLKDSKAIEYFESLKDKGFTLVEVLAIIIILGLIAVITMPKINDSINNSRKNISGVSALSYVKNIEKTILDKKINGEKIELNGIYTINQAGNIYDFYTEIILDYSGEKPSGGQLTFINNDLQSACIVINGYAVTLLKNEITSIEKGNCDEYLQA